MSSLINNLNEIYEIKQEIKEILQTDEEVFSYYPQIIQEQIASGGATGTYNIVENGTWPVATYAYAYVNVPQQEVPVVPPGYTYVYGGKEIITNGNNIDIASYSYINVSVPAPEGWLYPSGYAYITTNGDFNIREFTAVNVAVPQSGLTWDEVVSYGYVFPTGTYAVTANGTYPIGNYAYTYVNVQGGAAVLGYTTITTNGTTYASSFDLDGFSYINVAVPQSGSSYTLIDDVSDISASDQLVTATVVSTADNYATYITPEMAQQNPLFEHFIGTYLSDKVKLNGTDILFAAAQYFGKGTYMCNATTYIMNMGGSNMYCLTAGDNLLVGGVPASGTYNINTNGTFDISSYQYCSVSVPESIVLPYVMFAKEQSTDLPIFVNPNDSTEKYYVVSANNANYGDYYYVELKPLYNTASNPMVYTVEELNLVEPGTTTTATWYFKQYDYSWVSYKYGSNGSVASHYVSLHDGVNIYNPVTFLLNNNYSEFTTMTADTPVEISYITFGGWNLIHDYSIPNS